MGTERNAYLIVRRSDDLGNVYELHPGRRYLIGRAKTSEIVLTDDLCSRQHAEVFFRDGQWRIRDCDSLNGTRVRGELITGERVLFPKDEVHIGRTCLVFVESLDQIQDSKDTSTFCADDRLAIRKRLGQTRYEFSDLSDVEDQELTQCSPGPVNRHRMSRDLSLLYRLALDLGSATSCEALARVVLNGLLEATVADAAALLQVQGHRTTVFAHQERSATLVCPRLPDFVLQEVIQTREAIFAEHPQRLRMLEQSRGFSFNRTTGSTITSLICAPVVIQDRIELLLQLCCVDPLKAFVSEDLELTMAVARQLALAWQAMQRHQELCEENQRLRAQVLQDVQLIGDSPAMRKIKETIQRVAPTNATVLIRGESGVGKELVARALHFCSARASKPFVCLNCAALAESLLESELFGHEKGAFTGATERKIGKFEAAHGGTIFLDEIGELTPSAQAKLLRIIEGHPYERVGGSEPIRVNVRVIAATNRPLEEAVRAGQFRRDLYYRLQVVEIVVPPLHERREDIPQLAHFFLQQFVAQTGRKIRGFTTAALRKLQDHSWPGNVRELRNVIERAVVLGTTPVLDADDIWLAPLERETKTGSMAPRTYEPLSLEEVEKRHILATLEHTKWNKSQAARILGIERSTLDRKVHAYGLQRVAGVREE